MNWEYRIVQIKSANNQRRYALYEAELDESGNVIRLSDDYILQPYSTVAELTNMLVRMIGACSRPVVSHDNNVSAHVTDTLKMFNNDEDH